MSSHASSSTLRGVADSHRTIAQLILTLCCLAWSSAQATYSIIACDALTKACGVAVQTNNLAVGASVPYAQAGVGAVASQFETNPAYGPRALALMKDGDTPAQALQRILAEDGHFEDQGPEARQVALVRVDGATAVHTGVEVQQANWAGSRNGRGYSIQGNGLVGPLVIERMEQAYLHATGPLAIRLMAALSAGDAAGGQSSGRESAALLVRTPQGWPVDIDLRVDHSSDPVGELRHLLTLELARRQTVTAQHEAEAGHFAQARALLIDAAAKAPDWPRLQLRAADLAMRIDAPELAMPWLAAAFERQPGWTHITLGDGRYAELGYLPDFHRWIDTAQEHDALQAGRALTTHASVTERLSVARRLLECGHPAEAQAALAPIDARIQSADIDETRADIALAQAAPPLARSNMMRAIQAAPNDARLRHKAMRITKMTVVDHPVS